MIFTEKMYNGCMEEKITALPKPQKGFPAPPRRFRDDETFITPEMIEHNPVLAASGLFAGDPFWQEVREEIERNREHQREEDEKSEK